LQECDINLNSYEFVSDTELQSTNNTSFVYDYLYEQRTGYLFLAYCFIKSQDIKIVRDLVVSLDPSIFLHPKLIYLFAERIFIEREQASFLVEILQKLVADLEDETAIRTYLHFHFEHFAFNKLATIDMNKKREILNRADTSTIRFVKNEIIKLALVDPLQVMFYLLNFSTILIVGSSIIFSSNFSLMKNRSTSTCFVLSCCTRLCAMSQAALLSQNNLMG
jgi:hypothetical protein